MIQRNRRNRPRTHVLAATFALASATALASPGRAAASEPAEAVPAVTIGYSASDLASDGGARTLYRRIALAARQVCPEYDSRDLQAYEASRTCQRQAVDRALRQVGNPRLASLAQRFARQG